jgi:FAD/FMN-containing dehydrogenase
VLVPGAPGSDEVRKPALVRFHPVRPAAIVRCEDANDVAETLAFARRSGVPVAIRSGGHCFAGRSSTVIDVAPMNHVSVEAGMATVGADTRLEALNDALHAHGVTLPLGCGPTVGIAGLTLGGGLGILGRKHGLTCDALVAAQVVLADGAHRRDRRATRARPVLGSARRRRLPLRRRDRARLQDPARARRDDVPPHVAAR